MNHHFRFFNRALRGPFLLMEEKQFVYILIEFSPPPMFSSGDWSETIVGVFSKKELARERQSDLEQEDAPLHYIPNYSIEEWELTTTVS